MEIQGPPIRYPPPTPSLPPQRPRLCSVDDHFRTSVDSTLVASSIASSPRPPAYGAESAPPHYEEKLDPTDKKSRRKLKRTLCIRLMTSIFITVLVSLIVAAVVARIHDGQTHSTATNS